MRHGLEHRDLDMTAAAGATSLYQSAKNPLRCVKTCDRICERRTQKLWPPVVDDNTQKAAQSLGHRVIARPIGIRTARSKAADRAVHEARIEMMQPLDPG